MSDPAPAEDPRRWLVGSAALWASGGLFVALAVLLRNAPLLFLAVPLLIAPALAWLSAPTRGAGGRLTWAAGGEGRAVTIEGRIDLDRGIPPDGVSLRFFPPEPLAEVGPPRVDRVPGQLRIDWPLVAERPCIAVLPTPLARWSDPLDLVDRPLDLTGTALRVERFPPEIARVRVTHLRRTTVYPGEVRSRERGRGGEFLGIRASVPGDTPREINWRASARLGRLAANEHLRERTGDLLIVLDLRPTPQGPRRDAELLGLGRAAAYGVATAFLAEKARVGLLTFGEYATTVPMGSGRTQAFRLRGVLGAATVSEVAGPVERLAVSARRYFPPGVGTLVISSLSDDDGPLLLAHLRRRGFDPFVLAPSPLPLLLPAGPAADRPTAAAARLLHLARRQRLAAAWKEAPVIDWEEYWSLAPLARFLARPIERRPGVA